MRSAARLTNVHMAVTIPPTVVISEWIGELKGASSHHINHQICNRKVLGWQDGYGVVSFGTKDTPWVVAYVRKKAHHATGQTFDRLERTDRPDEERGANPDEDPPDEEAR